MSKATAGSIREHMQRVLKRNIIVSKV
jgi:hypothetical protein